MKYRNYTERLEIRLTKEQVKVLKEMAKKYKVSDSEMIRRCILKAWEKI